MISYYGMPKAPDMTGTFMPFYSICTTFMQLLRRYDSKSLIRKSRSPGKFAPTGRAARASRYAGRAAPASGRRRERSRTSVLVCSKLDRRWRRWRGSSHNGKMIFSGTGRAASIITASGRLVHF